METKLKGVGRLARLAKKATYTRRIGKAAKLPFICVYRKFYCCYYNKHMKSVDCTNVIVWINIVGLSHLSFSFSPFFWLFAFYFTVHSVCACWAKKKQFQHFSSGNFNVVKRFGFKLLLYCLCYGALWFACFAHTPTIHPTFGQTRTTNTHTHCTKRFHCVVFQNYIFIIIIMNFPLFIHA